MSSPYFFIPLCRNVPRQARISGRGGFSLPVGWQAPFCRDSIVSLFSCSLSRDRRFLWELSFVHDKCSFKVTRHSSTKRVVLFKGVGGFFSLFFIVPSRGRHPRVRHPYNGTRVVHHRTHVGELPVNSLYHERFSVQFVTKGPFCYTGRSRHEHFISIFHVPKGLLHTFVDGAILRVVIRRHRVTSELHVFPTKGRLHSFRRVFSIPYKGELFHVVTSASPYGRTFSYIRDAVLRAAGGPFLCCAKFLGVHRYFVEGASVFFY